jgi:enoyl-CoA hydratase
MAVKRDDFSSFTCLETRRSGSTLIVTFNRPDQRNAINYVMEQEFYDALRIAQDDTSIACVVLTGAGSMFSSGHDFKQAAEEWEIDGPTIDGQPWMRSPKLLPSWYFEKPLIAAVHGYAGPHANAILLTCDFVIAATGTRFGFEQARIGVGPIFGTYVLMYFHFPMRVIEKLWLAGGWMDAEQAHQLHYVQRIVDLDDLEAEALRWADQLCLLEESDFRDAKRGIRKIYEDMGIERMQRVGYEPYVGSEGNQNSYKEFFELHASKGMAAAKAYRDQNIDETITQI